ncbi:hypothetical protein R6Q59_028209 [Mikania micrantha]
MEVVIDDIQGQATQLMINTFISPKIFVFLSPTMINWELRVIDCHVSELKIVFSCHVCFALKEVNLDGCRDVHSSLYSSSGSYQKSCLVRQTSSISLSDSTV